MVNFIRDRFGDEGFNKWIESLSDEAKEVYKSTILASQWYPLKTIISEPTRKMCDLFYDGDLKGAWESGEYSCEEALTGVYKMYMKQGDPHYIIHKSDSILPKYYDDSEIEAVDVKDKSFKLQITKFPDMDEIIEQRIAGWVNKATVLSGCENVKTEIVQSMAKGDPITEIFTEWD